MPKRRGHVQELRLRHTRKKRQEVDGDDSRGQLDAIAHEKHLEWEWHDSDAIRRSSASRLSLSARILMCTPRHGDHPP